MNLPNQLTLLRILLTPVVAWLLFNDSTVVKMLSFILFILASLTDWYDGYTARKYGYVSLWGKFLDPLADKILVSTVLVCFSILDYIPAWMVIIIITRDVIITTLRSYAIFKGNPVVTTMLAKTKTFGQMTVIYLIYIFYLLNITFTSGRFSESLTQIRSMNIILILMYIITSLTIFSGISYIISNRFQIRQIAVDLYRLFAPSDI